MQTGGDPKGNGNAWLKVLRELSKVERKREQEERNKEQESQEDQ
jgi:hypothetical protein